MAERLLNINSSNEESRCKVRFERNLADERLKTDFDGFRITFSTASFGMDQRVKRGNASNKN